MMYDVNSPFDIDQHKKTFVHYLEVIILPNGIVEYAVPSHQEKLLSLTCKKLWKSRNEVFDMCPPEYYGDFMKWLCNMSGCCALWEMFATLPDTVTNEQLTTLKQLHNEGLYYGSLTQ